MEADKFRKIFFGTSTKVKLKIEDDWHHICKVDFDENKLTLRDGRCVTSREIEQIKQSRKGWRKLYYMANRKHAKGENKK